MDKEIEKLGGMFRQKREERHLSLKEAENATSIRVGYLRAIETGDINEFLSGVYALGFTKQYAEFLGFDVEKLIKEYPTAFLVKQQAYDFSYGIGTLEVRGNLGGSAKWLPNIFWTGVAAGVLILAYYFSKAIGLI